VSRQGEVFAASRRYGVLMMIGMPMEGALALIGDDVSEGDVFISHDPEATKNMATHLSDVYLWKPIFVHGELLCWSWTFIHVSDIGGRVPCLIAPSSHEVYQEGLRITPQKLYSAGELNKLLLDMIMANCRTPDQNWGDMETCLTGLATAERRVHELAGQYDDATIDRVLDYAARYSTSHKVCAGTGRSDGTARHGLRAGLDPAGLRARLRDRQTQGFGDSADCRWAAGRSTTVSTVPW